MASFTVTMPNGQAFDVDGVDNADDARAAIRHKAGTGEIELSKRTDGLTGFAASRQQFGDALVHGLTLGGSNYIGALADYLHGKPGADTFSEALDHIRNDNEQNAKANPYADALGNITGGAVIPGLGAKTILQGGLIAGGTGTLQTYNDTGDPTDALFNGAVSTVAGTALHKAFTGLNWVHAPRAAEEPTALQGAAQGLGIQMPPKSLEPGIANTAMSNVASGADPFGFIGRNVGNFADAAQGAGTRIVNSMGGDAPAALGKSLKTIIDTNGTHMPELTELGGSTPGQVYNNFQAALTSSDPAKHKAIETLGTLSKTPAYTDTLNNAFGNFVKNNAIGKNNEFAPDQFASVWGKVNEATKKAINPDLKSSLDNLATVGNSWAKIKSQRGVNDSIMGNVLKHMWALGTAGAAGAVAGGPSSIYNINEKNSGISDSDGIGTAGRAVGAGLLALVGAPHFASPSVINGLAYAARIAGRSEFGRSLAANVTQSVLPIHRKDL
jgi:hypothetical protein